MSTVKVIEIIGSSFKSWDDAVKSAMEDAGKTIRNISGIEIVAQTADVEEGKISRYKSVIKVAFVHEGD